MLKRISIWKILLFTPIAIIILVNIVMWIFGLEIVFETHRERFGFTRFDLTGIVEKKYLDKRNHMHPTLEIKTKDTVYKYVVIFDQKTKLFDFIQVSDSVFNDSASFDVRIKREKIDTVINWKSSVNEIMYIED
ncbi:MAG: hypothetical protein JEY97_03225 [Bacteroidales bacterium]|nr:hypothetical protein [Bacteroidales bacterium]